MDGKRVIGVDLGGTKILAGVVDREGHVEHRREHRTPTASEDELLAGLDEAVEELLTDDIAALGFGIPSPIDQRTGRALQAVNIPLTDIDFRERMRKRFGLPVGGLMFSSIGEVSTFNFANGQGTTTGTTGGGVPGTGAPPTTGVGT